MIEATDLYNTCNSLTFVKHVFESFPSDVGHGDVVDIVPEVCVVPQRFTPCFIIRPYWSYLSDGASYEKILPFSFAISLILVTLVFRILNMQLFPTYNSDL